MALDPGTQVSTANATSGNGLERRVKRFAAPRKKHRRLLDQIEETQGFVLGRELRAWLALCERYEIERRPLGDVALRVPVVESFLELVSRDRTGDWPSAFDCFFHATSLIAVDVHDAVGYVASWTAAASGKCRVYHVDADVAGVWPEAASIAAFLGRLRHHAERTSAATVEHDADDRAEHDACARQFELADRSEPLPPALDPRRLAPRVEWLSHLFLGARGTNQWAPELRRAATLADYKRERSLVARWPHLGAYWLWSHYVFGHKAPLDEVLAATAGVSNPVVAESRWLIEQLRGGARVRVGRLVDARLIARFRDKYGQAPLASGPAKKRKTTH
jgi:hypothetical protein